MGNNNPGEPSEPEKTRKRAKPKKPYFQVSRKLSPSRRRLIRNVLENPGATQAEIGRMTGYADPGNSAHRALKSEPVRAEFRRLMDRYPELTGDGLAKSLAEQMKATKVVRHAHEGVVISTNEDADWQARHKAREHALRIRGILSNAEEEPGGSVQAFLVTIRDARKARGLHPTESKIIDVEPEPDGRQDQET